MSQIIQAYASKKPGAPLELFSYENAPLGSQEIDIKVHYCGVCHSDLSMLNNDWGQTQYPIVPGHEVVGEVIKLGSEVKHLKVGQKVGVGWFSESCQTCLSCLRGDLNLCANSKATIKGRHGGFADKVRCHSSWAVPVSDKLAVASVGPMFCGGITVFNPIVQCNVKPTDKVGVVGIGGLGHLAVQFLNKWGCEVFAFSSSVNKAEGIKKLGAHHVVETHNEKDLKKLAGQLDFILVTSNVTLKWDLFLNTLAPKGKIHFVGAVLESIPVAAFSLIGGQKSVGGSGLGSPATILDMLSFSERHSIAPVVEEFPMSKVNEAIAHLEEGKARFRVVLKNDF